MYGNFWRYYKWTKTSVESVPEEKHEEEMNFDDFFTEMMHEMDNELISEGYDSSLV